MGKAKKQARIRRTDWIEAGLWLLAEEGSDAITIDRLCANLGVTKGSFYWHFQGRQEFLQALADYWGKALTFLDQLRESELDDWAQLREVVRKVGSLGYGRIDQAMRIWAGSCPETDAAVKKADSEVTRFTAEKLRNMGLNTAQAKDVALLIVASGIGLTAIDPPPGSARLKRLDALWLQLIESLQAR